VLSDCGARVTLADVDEERLDPATLTLGDRGSKARSFAVDVSEPGRVQPLVDDVVGAEGGVDLMFANAGIAAVPEFSVDGRQTLDAGRRVRSAARARDQLERRALYDAERGRGDEEAGLGCIVVTSSIAGLGPEPLVCYGYLASKAAVTEARAQTV
jgi:gluconate 5-dehydrogenase